MNYVGLDVHKKVCHATVMDERGKIMKEEKFENTHEGFEKFFDGIDDAEVAMEACYCWQPAHELLENEGYEVKLAHPLKTRIIAEARIKTDRRDSRALAPLLRLGWLPTSYVPPKEIRELRELTRLRTYLVMTRTRFKNKVHAELAKRWIGIRGYLAFAKCRRQMLREFGIETVNRCLSVIEPLDEQIKEISAEIKRVAGESQEAKWLMSIPGVGYFSAVAILAEIGDVSRFSDAEKLCSYAGLVPSTYQSSDRAFHGRITKQGSPILRWVLEQCVWAHLRCAGNTSLTRFFHRVARKRGEKKAAVATARKLLRVIYQLLVEKREFYP